MTPAPSSMPRLSPGASSRPSIGLSKATSSTKPTYAAMIAAVNVTATRHRAADTASSASTGSATAAAYMKHPSPPPWGARLGFNWDEPRCLSAPVVCVGLLVRAFVGRAGTGRAHEQLLAVREGDVAAVGAGGAVLGLEALDQDLGAGKERVLVPPAAEERVRRAALDHPLLGLAVGGLDVDVDPGVRVDPLHLGHRAPQLHRPLGIELGGKRVVRNHGHRGCRHNKGGPRNNAEQFASHRFCLPTWFLPGHWGHAPDLPTRVTENDLIARCRPEGVRPWSLGSEAYFFFRSP